MTFENTKLPSDSVCKPHKECACKLMSTPVGVGSEPDCWPAPLLPRLPRVSQYLEKADTKRELS